MDLTNVVWQVSSYTGNGGNTCYEVGRDRARPGSVFLRDSKDRSGPALEYPAEAWGQFLAGIKAGEFADIA
jgi:Domain of unknown function (DUF397)